jgi:hypothetical protein
MGNDRNIDSKTESVLPIIPPFSWTAPVFLADSFGIITIGGDKIVFIFSTRIFKGVENVRTE